MNTATNQLKAKVSGADLEKMSPKDQIATLLLRKRDEIQKMLPKHLNIDRLTKVAQIAATTTPDLLNCSVPSLIGAIGQCAQMGLEPNTVLGHAYLIPFNSKKGIKTVQVIVGYKGLIDLARRSGQIQSIAAHEVREFDHFEYAYGLNEVLEHRPALKNRGEIIGFYAVAKLVGGGYAFEFMSKEDVDKIKNTSNGRNNPVWTDNYVEMGRKTVIRRLAKYLPLSIEFQKAVALDEMAERNQDQRFDENVLDGDYIFSTNEENVQQESELNSIQNQTIDSDGVVEDDINPDEIPH